MRTVPGDSETWRAIPSGPTVAQCGTELHSSTVNSVNTFKYPDAGQSQPHTVKQVDTTGPNGTSQDKFTYDASGNTTSRSISGDTQTLDYDAEGRVSKVKEAGGAESTFVYDADGGRLIAREPSATTLYVFGQQIRLEKNTTTPSWTRYYSHNGHVVAQRNSISGLKWLLSDHQGTEIAAVNAGPGLAVASRRQTPFGESRGNPATPWNTQGFVGGTREESGLTRVGARMYDPAAGRFLSADPIIDNNDPQQLNGYAYSNNSPVTFSDPTGLLAGGQCGPDGILCGGGRENYQSEDDYKSVLNDFKKERSAQQQQSSATRQAVEELMRKENISQAEYEQALKNAHMTKWDVIKEAAWEMLKDISGWNDIVDCFTKGDIWACGGLVMNLVPWGKVGKVLEAGYKAIKAVSSMAKVISKAKGLLRRVESIAARGAEIAMNALRKLGGKPDCPNSFLPGTKVLLADGCPKPIEEVQNGDQVLATDEKSGESAARAVVGTIVGVGVKNLVEITVDGGDKVTATDNHPFWLPEQQKWLDAKELQVGSVLQTSAGSSVRVAAVRQWTALGRVHNLTVDGVHTYYALAGSTPLLVHNSSCDLDAIVAAESAESKSTNTAGAVALDSYTGQWAYGESGMIPANVHPDLQKRLNALEKEHGGSLENWNPGECAEFNACNNLLLEQPGVKLNEVVYKTIVRSSGKNYPSCDNCLFLLGGAGAKEVG
ncbi:polymorphic toxin-type HINT domain-containing protein [Lentzea sp. CA-135723]|uniref:polymorphic toxin-type HINT domain-containing protein n=1 Tax=Lentzea sp. CA-135723 TaxID=3239950 RepID=UPI003D8C49F9